MIKIVKQKDVERYSVLIEDTNKLLGFFDMNVDGYYYFIERSNSHGYWSSNHLRIIADKLDELNKPIYDKLKQFFEDEK